MSAFSTHALDAVAFQLIAALEKYDQDTARMVGGWPDLELYRSVSEQAEKIRMYSSALTDARVQWVELLIAHAELVHVLWRAEYGAPDSPRGDLETVRQRHADCIAALRNRCMRIIRTRPQS
ncbi:MAG TPA: hypothetical protein VHL79_08235 [Ramlibacter sp.]|jgi:hypothetical protein|nr:hypothetical protein [Ramlibacter sp.]